MKKLPVDVSTFEIMISKGYVYVDKTEYIYNLITQGRYYFLSRPRRFGKSLLISTLKELFLARRHLFEGLWIDKHSDYDWQEYPVIHLDFSVIGHDTPEELKLGLLWSLNRIAERNGIQIQQAPSPGLQLQALVEKLAEKNKVVILIDEYDKPLLDHLKDIPMAEAQRDVLRSFYETIKGLDAYLHAIFITGVSKFSKTSIFSGINNLNDISWDSESAQLLGYTSHEVVHYLSEYIEIIANRDQLTIGQINDIMKAWYNGYRFSEKDVRVYNPFSILYFLKKKKLANY
jgi:hypothetical protein